MGSPAWPEQRFVAQAFDALRRPSWPATLAEALAHPVLGPLYTVQLRLASWHLARGEPITHMQPVDPARYGVHVTPWQPTAPAPAHVPMQPYSTTLPHRRPTFDARRAAAHDIDD